MSLTAQSLQVLDMLDNIIGLYAESRAGNDKGKIFIIVKVENEYAWIADGKSRSIEKPKRKNLKHLIIYKNRSAGTLTVTAGELREKLLDNKPIRNEDVKYVLERFKRICQSQI